MPATDDVDNVERPTQVYGDQVTTTSTSTLTEAELAALNAQFESADPREIVRWAVETFGEGLSVGASFGGASGMAILRKSNRSLRF